MPTEVRAKSRGAASGIRQYFQKRIKSPSEMELLKDQAQITGKHKDSIAKLKMKKRSSV
jgi:hypothetical protein